MKGEFDDMPDGAGKRASEEDYSRIWRYMASRNRHPSVRTVLLELQAQNFVPPSVATSARWAKKLGLSSEVTASTTKEAESRQRKRREKVQPVTVTEIAETTGQEPAKVERTLLTRMKELLEKDKFSSTELAITENRTRMAFNVALMEFYAENPALLANVRDAAAFLDATTIASKLSGGPSIDITLPQNGDGATETSPAGHPMKTVGQSMANVDHSLLSKFREFQRNGAGA